MIFALRVLRFLFFSSLLLIIVGCAQKYSDVEERSISLGPGDLEQGGLAFITPSTVTGQEEEKQAVALTFADVLKRERPKIRVVNLAETLSILNAAGLSNTYKKMYEEYRDSGLFKQDLLLTVSQELGTRYLAQLKLQGFSQNEKDRLQILGLRIIETKQATLRLFLQIWDGSDGTIAWEGLEELRRTRETILEEPVTLYDMMELAAKDMIEKLLAEKSAQESQ